MRAGFGAVTASPVLRAIAGSSAMMSLTGGMFDAVYILFYTRQLGLSPSALGFIFAVGSVGFLAAAPFAGRVADRYGLGRTLLASTTLMTIAQFPIALAGGPPVAAGAILAAAGFVTNVSRAGYAINQVSLRQAVTPNHLRGRLTATMRFMSLGLVPVGALLGGALGATLGLRPTLLLAAIVLAGCLP